jgi:hypothetical protein
VTSSTESDKGKIPRSFSADSLKVIEFQRFFVTRCVLRVILKRSVKMVEESIIFDCMYTELMVRCLLQGPFSATSSTKCLFIQTVVRICEEFENDLSLGLLDILEKALRQIDTYDQILNQHTDAELNAVSSQLSS